MIFVKVQVVHRYSSTEMATAWKKSWFILSEGSDFRFTDNLLIAANTFPYAYFDITFSRWDTAVEVWELVN